MKLLVRATLEPLEEFEAPKIAEQMARDHVYRKAADELTKIENVIRTRVVDGITKVLELELYVFTPVQYHAEVALEARRLIRMMQRYPMYSIGPQELPPR